MYAISGRLCICIIYENIKDIIDDWKIYKEYIKKNNSPDYIINRVEKHELVIKIINNLFKNEK
jgi:hypothetical protein